MNATAKAVEADHIQDQLFQRIDELEHDKSALAGENERLRLEAEGWAQEARTHRATVHEIYRIVTGGRGEPGDWHGAEPVRREFDRMRDGIKKARIYAGENLPAGAGLTIVTMLEKALAGGA